MVNSKQIGTEIMVPTAEDVIVMKLRWAQIAKRGKDRDDVCNIIVHHWCAQHGTRSLLDEIRASIPPLD